MDKIIKFNPVLSSEGKQRIVYTKIENTVVGDIDSNENPCDINIARLRIYTDINVLMEICKKGISNVEELLRIDTYDLKYCIDLPSSRGCFGICYFPFI